MSAGLWHATPTGEVFTILESTQAGLTTAAADQRRQRDGDNELRTQRGPSNLRRLLAQFVQPLVIVLLGAVGLSLLLGDYVDAGVIAAVVLANGILGYVQESRAERAIEALGRTLTTAATVLRDGQIRRLPSRELARGDVVLLQSGDTVPADLRLFALKDLQIEEAALTGESVAVAKALPELPAATTLGDRRNLAFAGSNVTYGQGRGVVVAIGNATAAGQIADLMARTKAMETPLTQRIAQLSRRLVWVILGISGVMFSWRALAGADLADTFQAAVALAVGAIPEGLPAAVTILLAVGVSTMARRAAVIRRLPAVETLGSTTVICSDKTGTLTENQMTVTHVASGGREYTFTGSGFAPIGEVHWQGQTLSDTAHASLRECLLAGALCNDARLTQQGGMPGIEGDPTEAALLVAAAKLPLAADMLAQHPRLDVVPFESQHMYMATLHPSADGPVLYAKGSSDALLTRCRRAMAPDGTEQAFAEADIQTQVDAMASDGLRVLVAARKQLPPGTTAISHRDVDDLVLLGLFGMIDPPRPEAKRAIATCHEAGIDVKMITGDHRVTAAAIAAALGLRGALDAHGRLRSVSGQELAGMADEQLNEAATEVAVFARVAPEQKLALVRALQRRGHVVAMTGDGVNDAPALKQADIGIAMGRSGTDVARAAAAMVLTDDNFATIEAAVEEGRTVYDNLVKFIAWTLPTNGGEAVVLLTAMLLGTTLPVLPVQLLWINLVTAVLLGTALVFEPREPGLMQRPPRPPQEPILSRALLLRTVLVSLVIGLCAFGCFERALAEGCSTDQARTIAVNAIVVAEVGYLFACRSLRLPIWRIQWFGNPYVWIGAVLMLLTQVGFTYLPVMNHLMHTEAIPLRWWLVLSSIGFAVFLAAEAKKVWVAARNAAASQRLANSQ